MLRINPWKSSLPVSSETGISQLTLRNRCSSGGVFGEINAEPAIFKKPLCGFAAHRGLGDDREREPRPGFPGK